MFLFSRFAVASLDVVFDHLSKQLADELNVSLYRLDKPLKYVDEYGYLLLVGENGVSLAKTGKGAPKPVLVEFTSGATDHRRRFGGGKGQDIAKAVGLNKRNGLRVLDATAGLGRDAFVLASLGCQLSLCERVGFVRAMLKDGLARALNHQEVGEIVARMTLLDTDIQSITGQMFDVIYLDPMYPHTDKSSAAAKKEMAFFRDLVGKDEDADALLPIALELAEYRVVVKRPKGAPFLSGMVPTYQLEGKAGRFDVHVLKSLEAS
ncbi:class I SAM-dependent methyltransferase [Marinomonas spartinae]|uniref:class I SAM-dependent methyltransferase n=1 Tax=Marinomonas spartinae TaxID=1792290 RepID=UPI0009F3D97C|nr:class I SAM-dependent methyltransferase [Marinomonas spartinae]